MTPLLAAAIVAATVSIGQVPSPRANGGTGWITDLSSLIAPETEVLINSEIDRLHRDRGIEMTVVTIDACREDPGNFATTLFNKWGIGRAGRNDGVMILLVKDERELIVRTGDGIRPVLTDAWLQSMQDLVMVPRFKTGDMGGGLLAGVGRIGGRIRDMVPATGVAVSSASAGSPAPPATDISASATPAAIVTSTPHVASAYRAPPPHRSRSRSAAERLWAILMLAAWPFAAGAGFVGKIFYDRYQRTCQACKLSMVELDEITDDSHLTDAQKTEERIGSIDWKVYVCGGCGHTKQFAKAKWFSSFGKCRACSTRAMKTESRTLVHATYSSGGQVEVTERCHHCKHVHTYIRNTPRRTQSSSTRRSSFGSSSSSRSSGFSGGRSSGGGSRSKW